MIKHWKTYYKNAKTLGGINFYNPPTGRPLIIRKIVYTIGFLHGYLSKF